MGERRRVLIVIDAMEVGGSQRQIVQLLSGLDRARWEPELAFFRNGSFLSKQVASLGTTIHQLPKRGRIDVHFVLALAGLLRRRDYALVHAYSLTAELWTVIARLLSGRHPPLIASERSAGRDERPEWYWWLKRFVLARSAAVIANSRSGARSTARRTGVPETFFSVVANGVTIPDPMTERRREAVRRSLGVPAGCLLGLFVGRLVAVKNLPCLVRALATIEDSRRPWVALAGDGPQRCTIEALAREVGVADNLRMLGQRSDATTLMQAADFLVLPSRFEGLSNSLLEAMAAGCPVIASDVGGNRELIEHGRTGLLFPSNDSIALAAQLGQLTDPVVRSALAAAALDQAKEKFSTASLIAATSAIYDMCSSGPQCTGVADRRRNQRSGMPTAGSRAGLIGRKAE